MNRRCKCQPLQYRDRLGRSESDVCSLSPSDVYSRSSKVDPRTVRVKIFLMAVDP